ncbi:hypothetical protein [Dysgonomonas sp. 25]|uniref:hypothetical protein n=1 Tax=Dysgonomonas sp. 25 TaxID=2302933 RepID=UPI0013D37697|nr:hypothetical protein [Dysgonomonas sp. 25]NDV69793.1 hypothetical protein [Dysgonomonas sp. 25]
MKTIYKNIFLLAIIVCCNTLSAQEKSGFRIIEGECKVVIDALRKNQGNDSIAVEIFKKEYLIDKMSNPQELFNKKYTAIINYFDSKEGRKYQCRLKDTKIIDPILLSN